MEEKMIHITETDTANLKQKALPYLPRNLGAPESQRQIMRMIAQIVPELNAYEAVTNRTVWPEVSAKKLPVNQAIAQCAYQTNNIIGSAFPNKQMLEYQSEISLLQAWIALDYYGYVLKAKYSVNILKLQNQIAEILLTENFDKEHIVPVHDYDLTAPVKPIEVSISPSLQENADNMPLTLSESFDEPLPKPVKKQKVPKSSTSRKTMRSKKLLIPALLVLVVLFAAVFLFNAVNQTQSAIRKIGTVTLESEDVIVTAEQKYDGLAEDQQSKVSNRDQLFSARAEYDRLVAEDAISQIGKVTMESNEAIIHAEQLYDALSVTSRDLVTNYKTLTAARKEYTRLENAIKKATDNIDAIGKVTLQSGSKIQSARESYDVLKKDNLQSYLSAKVSVLTSAEKEYDQLVSQDLYDTGLSHHQKSDYAEAINCFDSIITDHPNSGVLENAKTAKAGSQIALAEQSHGKRDYYTAMKTLDAVDAKYQTQENYIQVKDKVVSALTKARPQNKASLGGNIDWGYCYFKISGGDQDTLFKFQNEKDPSKYKLVYIRAHEEAEIKLKDGFYNVKLATGQYWYDKELLFGDDTVYEAYMLNPVEFSTTYSGNWVYFHGYKLDMTSALFLTEPIKASEF